MLELSLKDVVGVLLVYLYIVLVFFIVEKLWKGDKAVGRKILHISMGLIVFFIGILDHRWVAVTIAGSFVIFSLLITQRMQLYFLGRLTFRSDKGLFFQKAYRKIITKLSLVSASDAGNEFGLVYYCLAYTALALLFFNEPVIIAIGILPLAFGDGLGAVIGKKFGRHPYKIFDKKSLEGSLAVFAGTAAMLVVGMAWYGIPLMDAAWKAAVIGLFIMVIEGIVPKGLDNLAIPVSSVLLYYFVLR